MLKLQVSAYDVRESEDIHFRYKRNIAYGYIGKDAESGNQILWTIMNQTTSKWDNDCRYTLTVLVKKKTSIYKRR